MIQHVEISLRLSPRAARTGMAFAVIGAAHFINRRFDEAVPKLLLAIQEDPNSPAPYRVLASCYAHMGRMDEAREIAARLRAISPRWAPSHSHLREPRAPRAVSDGPPAGDGRGAMS